MAAEEVTCPVCLESLAGDEGEVEEHVDGCLSAASRRVDEERVIEEQERIVRQAQQQQQEEGSDGAFVGDLPG